MIDNKTPIWIGICLIVTLVIAGCVSPTPPAPVQTPAPTTAIQTVLPTTPEATVVTVVSTRVTPKPSGTVIDKEMRTIRYEIAEKAFILTGAHRMSADRASSFRQEAGNGLGR